MFDVDDTIWVAHLESGTVRQVADVVGLVDSRSMARYIYGFHADMSPDGSSIVYSTCEYRDGRLVETLVGGSRQEPIAAYEIGTVSVEGDGKRRLTKADGFVNYPSWSPDGEQIAFVSYQSFRPRRVDSYHYPDYNFYHQNDVKVALIAADGSEPQEGELRRIQSTRRVALYPPVWSPDGQRLAYLAYEGEEDYPYDIALHVVGLDGSNVTRIGQATGPPSWSPDGEELAFPSLDGEAPIIYAVKPDGADLRTIWRSESDDSATSISQVSWSPDGSQLLFISDGAYVVRPDGSDLRLLPWAGARGAWSPDGSRIAIYQPGLYTVSPDGMDPIDLIDLLKSDAAGDLFVPNPDDEGTP